MFMFMFIFIFCLSPLRSTPYFFFFVYESRGHASTYLPRTRSVEVEIRVIRKVQRAGVAHYGR